MWTLQAHTIIEHCWFD